MANVKSVRVLVSKTIQEREYEPYRIEAEAILEVDESLDDTDIGAYVGAAHLELNAKISRLLLERIENNQPKRRRRGEE